MSDDPDDVPLELVLEAAAQAITSGIQTSQPGIITNYDHASQRASVVPTIQRAHVAEDDSDVVRPQPEIHDAIVLQMGTGRGRITFPIQVGDPCLIFHTCVALDRYKLSRNSALVAPGNPRRHHLSDAVVLPGIHTFNSVPTDAPTDAMVLWAGNGIKVKVGGTGGESTAMMDTFLSHLQTLLVALNTFAGTCVTTPPSTPATTLATAITTFNSFASSYKTAKTEVK